MTSTGPNRRAPLDALGALGDAGAIFRQDRSLRTQVGRLVVGVIGALAVAHGATSLWLYRRALEEQLVLKADAVARSLAGDAQLEVGVWAGYEEGVEERLRAAVSRQAELRFAAVVDDKARVLGFVAQRPSDQQVRALLMQTAGGASGAVDIPGIHVADAQLGAKNAEAPRAAVDDDLGLLDPGSAPAAAGPERKARVVVGVDRSGIRSSILRHAGISAGLGLVALVLANILVGRVFAGMFRRMRRVTDVAETLAKGDLREAVGDPVADEIGAVARSVERVRERWTAIVGGIRGVSDEVGRATRRIGDEATRVADGSSEQTEAARASAERSSAIVKDSEALKHIVDGMASITRQSRDSLAQARESSRGVAAEMDRMLGSLEENNAHREELSRNTGSISRALQATSSAVRSAVAPADEVSRQMEGAVEAANGIAEHARTAVAQSGRALSLLEKQRKSADDVAADATETAEATRALQDAMGEVLNTTALIRDIADMTSMLSLNASIIAAQAGDRALGFGTVADEIRQLATRTRKAVDGIEERADGARRQLDAMGAVVASLSATVGASRASTNETTTVLEQVLEQMNGALADVGGLAGLISEAADRTRRSRDAVGLIEREVTSIETVLARQAVAQSRLDESFAVMRKNAGGVRETSRHQAQSTDVLIEHMTRLAKATEELVALSSAQIRSAQGIAQDTARVQLVSESNRKTVEAITAAVGHLDAEARALREAVGSLQTGSLQTAERPGARA